MNLKEFLAEKSSFLLANFIAFILCTVFMVFSNIKFLNILIVGLIWFVPLISYIMLDYLRWKKYFNNIEQLLEKLDKKYLLPEVIDHSDSIMAEKIEYILKVVSKSMHENVKFYYDMQEDYREYIETWVHEIKTPISSSKLIIENNHNETTKKIDAQIDKIEYYVEQVLYYSRSNETEKDYIVKKVNLNESVRSVIKRNYRDMIAKKIKVDTDGVNGIVYSDPKWIGFIINQIIINSIKYSKDEDSFIKISSKEFKNFVVLTIEDNGIGIPEKDVNRVFEKGFTGDNGRQFGKSTGIGLYLCKKLCVRLGIGISLQSEEGVYTEVSLTFSKNNYMSLID